MPIARFIHFCCVAVFSSLFLGCGGGGGSSASNPCITGDLRCSCYANDTCNGSLSCVSKVCVQLSGQDAATPDIDGAVATGGATGGAGNTGGTGVCASGNAGCLCFPNGTCNGNLVCLSSICVVPSAAGGAAGGATATAGTAAGGTGATGGTPGTGGNTAVIPAGGTTTVISGGAIATGGVIPVGGTIIGGTMVTGGSIPAGGTTATGGAVAPGGTTAVGGGGAIATGGVTTGTTGTASNQVCPDATHCTLGLDGSRAPLSSNTYGIDGTFYLVGDGCATLTWDAQTRCASGTLCAKDPPDYLHWGAEIALNLRTGGGYDYPFDATAKGVTGFFWEITGTAPGMQVWIPLTTNPGACLQTSGCALNQPPWGNPTPSLGPSGRNYVQLQTSSMSYDDWGASYDYPPPWDPTQLHSIVWKLPARASATSFNFCVQKVGVLHN